jgi:hypothetical protein
MGTLILIVPLALVGLFCVLLDIRTYFRESDDDRKLEAQLLRDQRNRKRIRP